jgi:predicted ester cyclase
MAFSFAIRMTHDGPMPMPDGSVIDPTGEKISFTSGVFWALDDGLVAEERGYFDATAIAMQIGLVG